MTEVRRRKVSLFISLEDVLFLTFRSLNGQDVELFDRFRAWDFRWVVYKIWYLYLMGYLVFVQKST